MLLRRLVVVGLVGFISFAANIATAQDAVAPNTALVGIDGVNFADPSEAFPNRFEFSVSRGAEPRFASLATVEYGHGSLRDDRRYEVAVVATAASGFDISFAQRGGVGINEDGEIERESRGSELRLGRGLRSMPRDQPSAGPTWYFFAASDDEALIWRPGTRTAFGTSGPSFALQERVEIGDLQAGITYEQNGWQASLAYVEREVSVRSGSRTFSQDESFAGVTLTMRR